MHTFNKQDILDGNHSDLVSRKKNKKGMEAGDVRKAVAAALALLCFSVALFGVGRNINLNASAYALVIDGQDVALFTSAEEAKSVLDTYLGEKSLEYGFEVSYDERVEVQKVKMNGRQCVTAAAALDSVDGLLTPMVVASVLTVDGEAVLAVADTATALRVLDNVKKYYINSEAVITDAKFREAVDVFTDYRVPELVLSQADAQSLLLSGKQDLQTHLVQSEDETLWTISTQYNVPVETLQEANNGLTSEMLMPGLTINLAEMQGILTVVVVKEETQQVAVAYSTKYVESASVVRGQENVKQTGVNGLKEDLLMVVEENGREVQRTQIASTVLIAPTDKVVEKGTKVVVASRQGVANGMLAWPLKGVITSRFGNRSIGYHSGLDIGVDVGTSVKAADAGKIIFAAWSGNYGYLVKVDHGSGLVTYYAHLSKISVNVGDTVTRGQHIAYSGNTGRSTGPHLHFEVVINGTAYDPLNYLP